MCCDTGIVHGKKKSIIILIMNKNELTVLVKYGFGEKWNSKTKP